MNGHMGHKRVFRALAALAVAVVVLLTCFPAIAGPYLKTAAMLVHENANAGRWVRANLGDKELAAVAHKMARARTDAASQMNVPAEVRQAHPHLLLALSAMESAMQAASEGKPSEFIRYLQSSSGEATTFRSVLSNLGYSLPEYGRSAFWEGAMRARWMVSLFSPSELAFERVLLLSIVSAHANREIVQSKRRVFIEGRAVMAVA